MITLKHFPEEQPSIDQELYIFPDPEDLENRTLAFYRPYILPMVFFVDPDNSPLSLTECYWYESQTLTPAV